MKSIYDHKIVDSSGNSLPWFTYPAIEYIDQLDLSAMRLFEWGSGNSSLYFASRCRSVTTVDNDRVWTDFVASRNFTNVICIYAPDKTDYIRSILEPYDIVVIDGVFRAECVDANIETIKKSKIIIVDNSNWYAELCEKIRDDSRIQVDFHGMGPLVDYGFTTTLFISKSCTIRPINHQPACPIGGNFFTNCERP